MNVKTSKEITDRQKAGAFLQWALVVEGPGVADDLTTLFNSSPSTPLPPVGDGEGAEALEASEDPGFHSLIRTSATTLGITLTSLVKADETSYNEKAIQSSLLTKRDDIIIGAVRVVVAMRRCVLGHHDKADLTRFGFGGETSHEAVPLLRQLERIHKTVHQDDISDILGESVVEGLVFDPKSYRAEVTRQVEALTAVTGEVGEAQRRASASVLNKQKKIRVYDRIFLREGRSFEDWCHLVGRDDLASRVRPSITKPGRTEEEPPDVQDGQVLDLAAAESPVEEAREAEVTEASDSPSG
jgi:hypothetical protein